MVWDQSPIQARGLCFLKDPSEPLKEVMPVGIILKYFPLLDAPGDDVM